MSDTSTAPPDAGVAPATTPTPVEPTTTPTQGATDPLASPGNLIADPPPAEPVVEAPVEPGPVEYKDLKLPEGIAADDASLGAFTAEAAKLGITQDKAEALLASVAPELVKQLTEPYRIWNDTQRQWQAEIKADPEFGGEKLAGHLTTISRVIDNPALTDPGFRDAVNATGAGNNPAIIRTLARWAALLSEGTHVAGAPAPQPKTVAQRLYPSMNS